MIIFVVREICDALLAKQKHIAHILVPLCVVIRKKLAALNIELE